MLVPPRLQLVSDWRLLFSLEQDGASLATLFKKCNEEREVGLAGARGGFVVVVRDSAGGVSPQMTLVASSVKRLLQGMRAVLEKFELTGHNPTDLRRISDRPSTSFRS